MRVDARQRIAASLAALLCAALLVVAPHSSVHASLPIAPTPKPVIGTSVPAPTPIAPGSRVRPSSDAAGPTAPLTAPTPTTNRNAIAKAMLVTPSSAQCTTRTLFSGGDQGANTLAVQTNGTPIWWGAWNPNPSQHGPAGAISVGAGLYNDYVASSDTSLWVWGDDSYGQYGNGTQIFNAPGTIRDTVDLASANGAVAVATSGSHVLLLRSDGTLWSWGDNTLGELGNGGTSTSPTLAPSPLTLAGVVQVVAGGGTLGEPYSMALTSGGTVWAWGSNREGQLGQGSVNNVFPTPTQITTISGVVAIAASPDGVNSVALKSDGTVWAWGRNNLGNGYSTGSSSPVQVQSLTGVAVISVSYSHTLVAKSDGTVWDWGDNTYGELDNGTTSTTPVLTPIKANSIVGATVVTAGDYYSEVLLSDGTIWGWGENDFYELGTGFMTLPYTFPVQPKVTTTVAQPGPCPVPSAGSGPVPGPSSSEMLGGGPIDELAVAPNCCQGVTPAIGNYWNSSVDLAIPGRGVPLAFSRTYNSLLASQNGPLGYGWTHSYNVSLTFDAGGNPTVHEENGATIGFSLVGGLYQPPTRVLATLVKNGDGTYTLNRRFQVHLTFNSTGQLTKLTDRNGYATTLTYNGSGQLVTVTDPATPSNRTLTFAYTNGLLTSVTDNATYHQARSVSFNYYATGDLYQVTGLLGGITFTYDSNHHLLTSYDTDGESLTNTIDLNTGVINSQTDADSQTTYFSYGTNSAVITDPMSNQVLEQYQNNALTARTKAWATSQAATWTYAYDSISLGITTINSPMPGVVTNNTWYPSGYLHTTSDSYQHGDTFAYDSLNDPTTTTDALLVTTTNTYDSNGNILKSSRSLVGSSNSYIISYSYGDPAHPGDVTIAQDANLQNWKLAYDMYGNLTSTIDPLGENTTYVYDNVGRMTSSVAPNGNVTGGNPALYTTHFLPDAMGNVLRKDDPNTFSTWYYYDSDSHVTKVLDSNGYSTRFNSDPNDQLTSMDRGYLTNYATTVTVNYYSDGTIKSQTDGRTPANTTNFGVDAFGRRTSATDPLPRLTKYAYDPAGHLIAIVSGKSQTTTFGYDLAGRLTSTNYNNAQVPNVAFGYDSLGQRSTMTDSSGQSSYVVDSLHRLTKATDGAGQVVSYGYDLMGHLTNITYPGGINSVGRTYDTVGRLWTVTDWLGHTTTYHYDSDSNLTSQVYPNGTTATFTPDNADRLMGIADAKGKTTFLSLTYGRDKDNNLTAENSQILGYNPLDQQSSANSGATTYAYDAANNLAQIVSGSNTTTNVFDAAEQISTSTTMNGGTLVKKLTYTFDLNGNRTQQTDQNNVSVTFGYDFANRLIVYGSNARYAYNGDGLRVSKTVSGALERYVWNIAEGTQVPLVDGATDYVSGFGGLPLEQISSKTVYYYHQDQLGSTRATTDSRGNVVNTYSYDSYGNPTACGGAPCPVTNPLQYAGQYVDSESGLMYLRARYYDPSSELFLSADPSQGIGGSPYAYALGSPQNVTDRTGLFPNLLAGWNAITAGMSDWNGWRSSIRDFSSTTHAVAGACGLGALVPGTQPFTLPCAATFAVLGAVADVALVGHGDLDRSALFWDALSIGGSFVGWYAAARAASAGARWSAILRDPNLRNTGIAGPAWRTMMGAKSFAYNWDSVVFLGATTDALTSIKRVADDMNP